MPIYNKRDKNNWYNSIPRSNLPGGYNPFADPDFDAEKMKENEFRSNGQLIAKIPKIEHRIFRRTDPEGKDSQNTYIVFLADRYYDREKKQTRNQKVILGVDLGSILPGMMVANEENYRQYFDEKGNLINDPLTERERQKEEEARKQQEEKHKQQKKEEKEQYRQQQQEVIAAILTRSRETQEKRKEERSVDEIKAALLEQEKRLDEKEKLLDEKLKEAHQALQEAQSTRERLAYIEEVRIKELDNRTTAHLGMLQEILSNYTRIVLEQAKRRPQLFMERAMIRTINEVLQDIRSSFIGTEAEEYLHLAEEPDDEDRENHPGTTYSQMGILLAAYNSALYYQRLGRLYEK